MIEESMWLSAEMGPREDILLNVTGNDGASEMCIVVLPQVWVGG